MPDHAQRHPPPVTLEHLPRQPWFHDRAFDPRRGPELAAKWALVPETTDVLVTHGPPFGVLDRTWLGEDVGCADLEAALVRIRPRLHLFGHIHEAYGVVRKQGTVFVNACNCDLRYRPVNPPIVLDWDGDEVVAVDA